MARKSAGWFRYLKEAFLFRWNLIFFGVALTGAAIAPGREYLVPLVTALDLTFITALTSLPRYQAAIDARASREERLKPKSPDEIAAAKAGSRQRLLDVIGSLTPARRNRFLRIRVRCVEMQRIAGALDRDVPSLDTLLWTFLRLLHAEQAIERFLATTDATELQQERAELEEKIKHAHEKVDLRSEESCRESLVMLEMRIDNLGKAKSNQEYIGLELDRIEQKIHALGEGATVDLDTVADGMDQTENTLRELSSITGVDDHAAPGMLGRDVTEAIRG